MVRIILFARISIEELLKCSRRLINLTNRALTLNKSMIEFVVCRLRGQSGLVGTGVHCKNKFARGNILKLFPSVI